MLFPDPDADKGGVTLEFVSETAGHDVLVVAAFVADQRVFPWSEARPEPRHVGRHSGPYGVQFLTATHLPAGAVEMRIDERLAASPEPRELRFAWMIEVAREIRTVR